MEWAVAVEVVLVIAFLVVVIPILWLYLRRRWLSRQGGMFDCSLLVGRRWVIGVARYSGEYLQWFRIFSLSLRPRISYRRTSTQALETRELTEAEVDDLYAGMRVVRLEATMDFEGPDTWELAMPAESVTGLLSWLEAAPPSVGRFSE